jgi:hypothetical protein
MQRDPEFFGDTDLDLIYIAKRLKEALKLEEQLTASGFDYLVEADRYRGGLIFQTERVGAFFYVAPDKGADARQFLRQNGYKPYMVPLEGQENTGKN